MNEAMLALSGVPTNIEKFSDEEENKLKQEEQQLLEKLRDVQEKLLAVMPRKLATSKINTIFSSILNTFKISYEDINYDKNNKIINLMLNNYPVQIIDASPTSGPQTLTPQAYHYITLMPYSYMAKIIIKEGYFTWKVANNTDQTSLDSLCQSIHLEEDDFTINKASHPHINDSRKDWYDEDSCCFGSSSHPIKKRFHQGELNPGFARFMLHECLNWLRTVNIYDTYGTYPLGRVSSNCTFSSEISTFLVGKATSIFIDAYNGHNNREAVIDINNYIKEKDLDNYTFFRIVRAATDNLIYSVYEDVKSSTTLKLYLARIVLQMVSYYSNIYDYSLYPAMESIEEFALEVANNNSWISDEYSNTGLRVIVPSELMVNYLLWDLIKLSDTSLTHDPTKRSEYIYGDNFRSSFFGFFKKRT